MHAWRLVALLAAFVFSTAALAETEKKSTKNPPGPKPMPAAAETAKPPSPPSELQKLQAFTGEWTYELEIFDSPLGKGEKFSGFVTGRPALDGFAYESIEREPRPWGACQAREVNWYDPFAKKFGYVYLIVDGAPEQGTFSMQDQGWTWEGVLSGEDRVWKTRGKGVFLENGSAYRVTAELSADGAKWIPFFKKTARKAVPSPAQAAGVERELIEMEHAWARAYLTCDGKALDRIEAEGWGYTDADGAYYTKAEDIADVTGGEFKPAVFEMADLKVRVFGDTAVVTGRQTVKFTFKGEPTDAVLSITDVFQRRDGRWQAISSAMSRRAPAGKQVSSAE